MGTVNWSNGATGANIEVSAGTYTATCVGSCGSSPVSNTVVISNIPVPTKPILSAEKIEICANETTTLTATNCNGNILWSNGATTSSISVSSGTYTAECSNECATSEAAQITINEIAIPEVPVIFTDSYEFCSGGSSTLTASNCDYTITWSNGMTGSSIVVDNAGVYYATCSNDCGTSEISNKIQIKLSTKPKAPLVATDRASVCGPELASLVAIGCDYNIVWSTGETTEKINVSSGVYTAKCVNACGESVNSNQMIIEKNGTPSAPKLIADKLNLCNGDTAMIVANVCSGQVQWNTGAVTDTLFVTTPGTYSAVCKNDCGTSFNSDDVVIQNGGAPSAPLVETNATEICEGTSATLSAKGCSGTITWSTGVTASSISVSQAGIYTAKCTNACGTSENSKEIEIKIKVNGCGACDVTKPVITASTTAICDVQEVTLSVANCDATVIWSNGKTGASIVVTPFSTTTYSAVCKVDQFCISEVSDPVTVRTNSVHQPVLSCSADLVCPGEEVTLSSFGCDGEVQWSNGAVGTSIKVSPTETVYYTAICVNGSCVSEPSEELEVAVGIPSRPFVSCRNSSLCLGEKAMLTASGCTGTVHWSNGQIGGVLEVVPSTTGTYSYTAICKSNVGDCESPVSNKVSITVGSKATTPKVVTEMRNVCPFETVDLSSAVLSLPSSGGQYEFHVSNSIASPLVTNTGLVQSGNYYVFERTSSGCFSDAAGIQVIIEDCGPSGIVPQPSQYVDLEMKMIGSASLVEVGDTLTYTMTVKNISSNPATNVTVRNIIPDGLAFKTALKNATFNDGMIVGKAATLNGGESFTVTYSASVGAAGRIANKAELFKLDQIDTGLANNASEFVINDPMNEAVIGLAKEVGQFTKIADKQYEVPYTIYVSNMGGEDLTSVQVTDDLTRTFSNGASIIDNTIQVVTEGTLVANPYYTGKTDNAELLVANESSLKVGEKLAISFKVRVDISNASTDEFYNSAIGSGLGTIGTAYDISTNGDNADPDNDGDPRNNEDKTPIKFNIDGLEVNPAIGVALSVVDTSTHDDISIDITYRAIVKNVGNVDLTNIQLVDSLLGTFKDTLSFQLLGSPVSNNNGTLTVNANYNGKTDNNLLMVGAANSLLVGESDSIFFTVRLVHENVSGPFFSSVYATADGNGVAVTDTSNDGSVVKASLSSPTILSLSLSPMARVIIPGGLSPNGDGVNDTWNVSIPLGIQLEVFEVYNRWGHLIWKPESLENFSNEYEWNGVSNQGIRLGDETYVPDGTYFFRIKAKGEAKTRVGYITVSK